MKSRSFADLLIGVLAYVSLTALASAAATKPVPAPARDARWTLPAKKRRRRRSVEDACRHCAGSGHCEACMPATCRVCRGSGLQPRDATLVERLNLLWDGSPKTT
jgi:hypothetical protein